MAFAVTNDFTNGTVTYGSEVQTNFSDIETELNAFPTAGALSDGAVSTAAKMADNIITWAKLNSALALDEDDMASNSATAICSQQSIKAYVDAEVAGVDPTYSGGESHTFQGGLIIKGGYESNPGITGDVTFGTAFPNSCISVVLNPYDASNPLNYVANLTAVSKTGFSYDNNAAGRTRLYWIAMGY